MNNYTGNVDWGDWQQMPDYRSGWVDKHKSGIGELLKKIDVGGYIPGLKEVHNRVNDATTRNLTAANTALSPVVKAINKYTNPTYKINKNNFIGNIDRFVEEKPADALAVAAATYFTAGAATPAATGGGAAAGAATSGLGAAGSAAITPALASLGTTAGAAGAAGTAGLTAAGSAAITPALASLAGSAASTGMLSGGLGLAGTAAAESMLTPSFASLGTAAAEPGLLSTVKDIYGYASKGKDYYSNLNSFAKNNGPTDQQRYNQQAGAMADRILNANKPQTARQKVSNQIMMNKFGMRA